MDSGSTSPLHVVIFPWLAFGRLIHAHDLAARLAARGHGVSFVSTPRNIARLPPVAAPLLEMVALQLPRVHGLPDGAESTNDVPSDKFRFLQEACDGLAAPFSEFLDAACAAAREGGRKKPDLVIFDGLLWVADAAIERNIPCAMCTQGPGSFVQQWWGAKESSEPLATLPRFEMEQRRSFAPIAERVNSAIERCDLVVVRTCLELEPDQTAAVMIHGKPVVLLGLLPPSPEGGRKVDWKDDATVRWLDAQPAKSVAYIALGSEVPLRVDDVHELALGLELAGTGFLWALRRPSGAADVLPPGFEERTRGRGLVVTGWVPQISVLAHGAVGAFLTHCGWSSVVEGLFFGHPLVMLPMYGGDQPYIAGLVEGWKAGVQVPRDEDDGSFHRDGVAVAVRAVMAEEESRAAFAASAKKLQETVADRELHERYIDRFVQQVRVLAAAKNKE